MAAASAPVEVSAPTGAEFAQISPLLARAFLDDPVWVAIGPRARRHRALANRASLWGVVNASARHGARIRIARYGGGDGIGGTVLGATIAFEPGRWPPPDRAAMWELGWAAVAGPLPISRGLRVEREMRQAHVGHSHLYLWFIGVEPEYWGRGIGRALMADVHGRADELGVPTYLETGTRSNVDFYESQGHGERGELTVDKVRLWLMERPAPGTADSSPGA